jgi:hypothetical protein
VGIGSGKVPRCGDKQSALGTRGFDEGTMILAQHLRLLACQLCSLAKLGHLDEQCSETSSSQNAATPFGKLPWPAYLPRQRQMGGTYRIALVQAVHLVCESRPTPRHAPHNCLGDRRDIGLGQPTAFSGLPPAFSGLPPAFLSVCHC